MDFNDIINEITNMIKDNLLLMAYNDEYLINIKKFLKNNDYSFSYLSYFLLVSFVEEALCDLIYCPYLYDMRSLE